MSLESSIDNSRKRAQSPTPEPWWDYAVREYGNIQKEAQEIDRETQRNVHPSRRGQVPEEPGTPPNLGRGYSVELGWPRPPSPGLPILPLDLALMNGYGEPDGDRLLYTLNGLRAEQLFYPPSPDPSPSPRPLPMLLPDDMSDKENHPDDSSSESSDNSAELEVTELELEERLAAMRKEVEEFRAANWAIRRILQQINEELTD
ncbi:hypothetical protein FRC07_011812 [Ceratobasidium sp. 392]|nr:hypothetical protein FRC07_011812 [Ceratobasidium sp. 392]